MPINVLSSPPRFDPPFPDAMNQRAVQERVFKLLAAESNPAGTAEKLRVLPRNKVLKALFAGLCANEELLRWHAVSTMGLLVADMANEELESARVVIRRFMWGLNDESGGIGWGIPEAMAECLVCHEALAREYTHILVAFMRRDGFFLEYEPLQRGLMWGLGRLAGVRPALLHKNRAGLLLLAYLASPDSSVRGLAAWALGNLKFGEAADSLRKLIGHQATVRLYQNGRIIPCSEGELARQALAAIKTGGPESDLGPLGP